MRHSVRDADAMDRYEHDMNRVCQVIKPLFDRVPPNPWGQTAADAENVQFLLKHLGGVPRKVMHDTVRLLTGSAADFLDDYFESDIIKGYLASSSIIGTKVSKTQAAEAAEMASPSIHGLCYLPQEARQMR